MATRNSEKLFSYLHKIHERFERISAELSLPETAQQPKKFRELSKELHALRPQEEKFHQLERVLARRRDAEALLAGDDPDLAALAREELAALDGEEAALVGEIEVLLVSDADEDSRNAFLEIRAGAGGDEASLFAADLLRMYVRVAERKKWKAEVISTAYSGVGGIKEVILYVKGTEVNKFLKFESGVHRVQRVPETEAQGRIQTSTVTVAVLPEAEDVEVELDPKDLQIDTFRSSGAGGQKVNKTSSAIRVTYLPLNMVVECQDERSQYKNKDRALKILRSRLYEKKRRERDDEIAAERRSQVGTGMRNERIRTYNFPQGRVTDHRIGLTLYRLDSVMNGDLDELVDAVRAYDMAEKLRAEASEI